MWHIHTIEYYSVIEIHEILIYAIILIMLRKVSKSKKKKATDCMIPYLLNVQTRSSTGTENQFLLSRLKRLEQRDEEWLLKAMKFAFCDD